MVQRITLTWLPSWHAYVVRRGHRVVGMVVCRPPLPFNVPVAFT
jgi:hypothetical protein